MVVFNCPVVSALWGWVLSGISNPLVKSFSQAGEKGPVSGCGTSLPKDCSTKDLTGDRKNLHPSVLRQCGSESEFPSGQSEFSPAWRAEWTLGSILSKGEKALPSARGSGVTFGTCLQDPDWAWARSWEPQRGEACESWAQEPGFWDRRGP